MSTTAASLLHLTQSQRRLFTVKSQHLNQDYCAFIAENESITITPSFATENAIRLVQGSFGPFEPDVPVDVPIWLAIMLKRQKQCRIIQPAWLTAELLTERVEEQRKQKDFIELPFYYVEIFTLLSLHGAEDIIDFEIISSLMADLQEIRHGILVEFLKSNDLDAISFYWQNICQFELVMIHHHVSDVQKTCHDWMKQKNIFLSQRNTGSDSYPQDSYEPAESQQSSGVRDLRAFRR